MAFAVHPSPPENDLVTTNILVEFSLGTVSIILFLECHSGVYHDKH